MTQTMPTGVMRDCVAGGGQFPSPAAAINDKGWNAVRLCA